VVISAKQIVIGAAAVVGAVVLWRLMKPALVAAAGSLVTEIGGKAVADAAEAATLGNKGFAKVLAMRGQTETA
jgi:hypothetical protein